MTGGWGGMEPVHGAVSGTGAAGRIFAGLYFDGRSALAHPVRVRITPQGLILEREGGSGHDIWPYESLVSSGPLIAGEPAVIGLKEKPGARLQVDDPAFRDVLLDLAPQLGARAHRRRQRKEMWTVIGALAAIVVIFFLLPIPWARMGASLLPESFWTSLGERLRPLVAEDICVRAPGMVALKSIEERLRAGMEAEGLSAPAMPIQVARMPMVNAFTLPGGHIVVTSALIDQAQSPEEVAGVMAHELGHALARHPEASSIRTIGLMGLVGVLTGSGDLLAQQVMSLVLLKYSRDDEREADRLAMRILKGARVDPVPLADFFRRLVEREEDEALAVLSTHPPSRERMEYILGQAGRWETVPLLDDVAWRNLRRICR